MNIHRIAKAVDTIAWFLGDFNKVQWLLEESMHLNGISGIGFFSHDGAYYEIRFKTLTKQTQTK